MIGYLLLANNQHQVDLITTILARVADSRCVQFLVTAHNSELNYGSWETVYTPYQPWTDDQYEILWQLPLITRFSTTLFLDLTEISAIPSEFIQSLATQTQSSDSIIFGSLNTSESKYTENNLPQLNARQILFSSTDTCNLFFDTLKLVGRNWAQCSIQLLPPNFRSRDTNLICAIIAKSLGEDILSDYRILNFVESQHVSLNRITLVSANKVVSAPILNSVHYPVYPGGYMIC